MVDKTDVIYCPCRTYILVECRKQTSKQIHIRSKFVVSNGSSNATSVMKTIRARCYNSEYWRWENFSGGGVRENISKELTFKPRSWLVEKEPSR